jgi:hypothetical protein
MAMGKPLHQQRNKVVTPYPRSAREESEIIFPSSPTGGLIRLSEKRDRRSRARPLSAGQRRVERYGLMMRQLRRRVVLVKARHQLNMFRERLQRVKKALGKD